MTPNMSIGASVLLLLGLAATTIVSVSYGALAQAPAWATGTWKGKLANYRFDPAGPDRALVIHPDGKCGWGLTEATAAASSQSCTLSGDTVSILSSAGTTIKLQRKNASFEGTFQTKGGTSYLITMTKQ